jgi:hypothetical protein
LDSTRGSARKYIPVSSINIYEQSALAALSVQLQSDYFPSINLDKVEELKDTFQLDLSFNATPLRAVYFKEQFI